MLENHSARPGVAQHALVLEFTDHVQPNPTEPALPAQSAHTTIQSDSTQESVKPKSTCLHQSRSRSSLRQWQSARRRGSTRSVYEAKWAIFTKWCLSNQVDFRTPPIKSVADFLMYLFQDRKCSPVPLMVTGQQSVYESVYMYILFKSLVYIKF